MLPNDNAAAGQPTLAATPNAFGPVLGAGGVEFRLWAPSRPEVDLVVRGFQPQRMTRRDDGFHALFAPGVGAGTRYRFAIDGQQVPDPASRGQDDDASGWSVVQEPCRPLPSRDVPRPWQEAIVAEVHVGTATPEGTFAALTARLPYFVEAGYTVLEIMPVNEFPGTRNWGYDGTLFFAPEATYGTFGELCTLVDEAHRLGLGLILDVVYNHFGQAENHVPVYAPEFFAPIKTDWGDAIDFTRPLVRKFFCENAAFWLGEIGFDGLRIDAFHDFMTDGADIFRRELAEAARAAKPDAYLVLESLLNSVDWLERDAQGKPRFYTAQWNDDVRHSYHVLATGETFGYLVDYARDTAGQLARALSEGFAFQGEPLSQRPGLKRGKPSAHLPPDAFMSFLQNHDQIGNRPGSERLEELVDTRRLDFLRFMNLLSPQIPMFFMGEEAHIKTKFPFFSNLSDEFSRLAFEGRKAGALQTRNLQSDVDAVQDPGAEETFLNAKLPWGEIAGAQAQASLARFTELAAVRQQHIWPLTASAFYGGTAERSGIGMTVRWQFAAGSMCIALNPGDADVTLPGLAAEPLARSGNIARNGEAWQFSPWSAALWVEHAG